MNFNKKGLLTAAELVLSGIYLLSFIIYYLTNFVFVESDLMLYLDIFLDKATFLLLPLCIGLFGVIYTAFESIKSGFISMLLLMLTRLVYSIPYTLFAFISPNADTLNSVIFSIIFILGDFLLSYSISSIVLFAVKIISEKKCGKKTKLSSILMKKTDLNISDPISLSFISLSLAAFAYFFISEIINTVNFIIAYSFNFTLPEILYTVISYLYILGLLFLHYYVPVLLKNRIIDKHLIASAD